MRRKWSLVTIIVCIKDHTASLFYFHAINDFSNSFLGKVVLSFGTNICKILQKWLLWLFFYIFLWIPLPTFYYESSKENVQWLSIRWSGWWPGNGATSPNPYFCARFHSELQRLRYNLSQKVINDNIDSMSCHVSACIAARGRFITYWFIIFFMQ